MKAKNLLPILLFYLLALNSTAQKAIEPRNTNASDLEKIMPEIKGSLLKSTNETMYLLDSVRRTQYLHIRDTMQVYTYYYNYDSEGNTISRIMRTSCEMCAGSDQDYKYEYQFDENGDVEILLQYSMDKSTQQWVPNTKLEYTYDANSLIPGEIEYTWDKATNQWLYSTKFEIIFNDDGEIAHYSYSDYDLDNKSWIAQQVSDYYYDQNGYDSLRTHTLLNSDGSFYYLKYEITVDSNGKEVEEISSLKDTSGIWTNNSKYYYEYDQNGNTILSESYYWSSSYNYWLGNSKTESEYDLNNHRIFSVSYRWDSNTSDWLLYSRYDYEYDMMGNQTLYMYYIWNANKEEWINNIMRTYEYDEKNMGIGYDYFEWLDNSWWHSEKAEYFYSEFTTGVNIYQPELAKINVYPNPAGETLIINSQGTDDTEGRIYNSTGELMKTFQVQQGENSYNLSDLKKGLYILQISFKDGTVSKKLIKN